MSVKTITLTEALAELKLLDKKIHKSMQDLAYKGAPVIDYIVGKKKTTEKYNLTEEEIKKEAQSKIDQLNALIANRGKLKAVIARTNAITQVTIAGKIYTIVEAIERKNNLKIEKELLEILNHAVEGVTEKVRRINENARNEVDRLLEAKLSTDSKNQSAQEIESLAKILLENKEAKVVDPYGVAKLIESMNNDIEIFEREVDVALSIINATTTIDIEEY
jgi:DNA repair exonuclease SbcCD nuclease subunit